MILLSKKDKSTKAEVIKYDDKCFTYQIRFLNGEKKERHYVPNKNMYDSFAMKKLYKEVKEQIRQEQVKKHKKA